MLKLGMHILRADGSTGVVTGWKRVPGIATMYNLTVEMDHTFTVGIGHRVVHNCGGTLTDGTKVSIPDNCFEHSFRHADEMLGRPHTDADKLLWRSMIDQAMKSRYIFGSYTGSSDTIAVFARAKFYDEMRPFVVHFFQDRGELSTAYQPNADQLAAYARILGIAPFKWFLVNANTFHLIRSRQFSN